MRRFYTLLLFLLIPLALLRLVWRGLHASAYWRRIPERFGAVPAEIPRDCIWVHAVSVGEFQAALPLIKALQRQHPEIPLLITTTTPTGAQRVYESCGQSVWHAYLPYDLPFATLRFLRQLHPRLGIIMETEIWPNLCYLAQQEEIPLVLVNARLSARSAKAYQRIRSLIAPALQSFQLIAAQTQHDAERLRELGATAEQLHVTGSIKFDLHIPASLHERAEILRLSWDQRPVWIAASTREGEEEQVLRALEQVREEIPNVLLVLVPRHPERFNKVAQLCTRQGHKVARRSLEQHCDSDTQVYLADTMGELPLLYAAVDVAFIGGSLMPLGGHNPLEAAGLGVPVIFGPHTFNFAEICQRLEQSQAACRVSGAESLAQTLIHWLSDANLRHQVGEQGRFFVDQNRGALARLQTLLSPYLPFSRSLNQ